MEIEEEGGGFECAAQAKIEYLQVGLGLPQWNVCVYVGGWEWGLSEGGEGV
jgi:hypothetical protein